MMKKRSIRTGINYQNNKVLTAEEKRKYEDMPFVSKALLKS